MQQYPIGIFDSGYGGLTILKEIKQLLPQYDFCYLGDNARAPYGTKGFDTVYRYTLQAVQWFFRRGCPLVILACNTASAKALRTIQQNDLPFMMPEGNRVLGVIRPTAEEIVNFTKSQHVGILGTPGTVQSRSYILEIEKFYPAIKVSQEACTNWVDLVEQNKTDTEEAQQEVEKHVNNILTADEKIDCLLLACTHYPLLLKSIQQATPAHVRIISQGEIVAIKLKTYLQNHPEIECRIGKASDRKYFTTGNTADFMEHAAAFYGDDVHVEKAELF